MVGRNPLIQIKAVGYSVPAIAVAPAVVHRHHREMARAAVASATEALAGLVDRVTFHNAENGFCVLRVKARGQRDLITLVGHAAGEAAECGRRAATGRRG